MTSKQDEHHALRRYAMIDPLVGRDLERGETSALLEELADTHGISVSTVKRYRRRYEEKGIEGLKPQSRSDAGRPRKLPEKALKRAIQLRTELPSRSTPVIIRMLEHEQPEWKGKIKRSTLDDHFHRLGITRRLLRQDRTARRRFQKSRKNALWQIDLCKPRVWVRDETGGKPRQAVLAAVLDDATRFIVGAEFFASEETWIVETTLKKAIARYGAPNTLYLDNGAQFTAKQIQEACRHLLIHHRRSAVGDPSGRGKLERFFLTFQDAFVPELSAQEALGSLVELNRLLWAWVEQHYHQSVHRELKDMPAKVFAADPTPPRIVDPITLEGAFLLRVDRTVDKTNLVSLDGRRYLVEKALPRQRVEVRYHPRHFEQVHIWYRGDFLQMAFAYETPSNSPRLKRSSSDPQLKPSTSYLEQLEHQREEALGDERDRIRSRPLPPEDVWNIEAFLARIASTLGRALTGPDETLVRYLWQRRGGFEPQRTHLALERTVAQWGTDRHPSVYLQAIDRAHESSTHKEETPSV